eukprot:1940940-Amphidinium_carterae.1
MFLHQSSLGSIQAVLCAVMVSPTVRGVCNHLTITPQGQFYSGPDKAVSAKSASPLKPPKRSQN